MTANGYDCWGVTPNGLLAAVFVQSLVDPDVGVACYQLSSRSRENSSGEQPLACRTDPAEFLTPALDSEIFWVG